MLAVETAALAAGVSREGGLIEIQDSFGHLEPKQIQRNKQYVLNLLDPCFSDCDVVDGLVERIECAASRCARLWLLCI